MSKVSITLTIDEEQLNALEFSLKKEKTNVQSQMDEALQKLYEEKVAAPLREYLDSKAAPSRPKRPSRPNQPRPKPEPRKAAEGDAPTQEPEG